MLHFDGAKKLLSQFLIQKTACAPVSAPNLYWTSVRFPITRRATIETYNIVTSTEKNSAYGLFVYTSYIYIIYFRNISDFFL